MSKPYENMKALVVDDYESIRRRLVSVLGELGFSVREASNGLEALGVLREESCDLMFTDIVMPEMDGFELCYEVRKSQELLDLPIVVVSTQYDHNYIIKALRLGADDYLPKPIEHDLVKKVVARVLTPTYSGAEHG